jgi:hypothetical protein
MLAAMETDDLDDLKEPCPGCDRAIDCTAVRCPFCKYDLTAAPPVPKVRKKREPTEKQKEEEAAKVKERAELSIKYEKNGCPMGYSLVAVPALGRSGRADIDFPELYFKKGEATDANLKEWAENLRYAWPEQDGERRSWLSNHAIGYIAERSKNELLSLNAKKIVDLLGGDDW